ncbi:hypothetical protein D9M68_936660 [compost metagenome]
MQFFHAVEALGQNTFNTNKILFERLVADTKKLGFCALEQLLGRRIFVVAKLRNFTTSFNEATTNGFLSNELCIRFGMSSGRYVVGKFGQVCRTTDDFKFIFFL